MARRPRREWRPLGEMLGRRAARESSVEEYEAPVGFDELELLDFTGPVEVLWSARTPGPDGKWTSACCELPGRCRSGSGRTGYRVSLLRRGPA
jgi:hypothetical protein